MFPLARFFRCGDPLLCAVLLACARAFEVGPGGLRSGVPAPAERRVERVLVIALDGASWLVLVPLIQDGRAPNLTRLTQNGVVSRLRALGYIE